MVKYVGEVRLALREERSLALQLPVFLELE
jgi:hypothetical protein